MGRAPSNSIVIDDDQVSRRHCEITIIGGELLIADLGSSNGTFVNGKRIQRSVLQPGDEFQIGSTYFKFMNSTDISTADTLTDPTELTATGDELNLKLDSDNDSTYLELVEDKGTDEAGRQFVQINNDLRFLYRASLATTREVAPLRMLGELMDLIFDWIEADQGYVLLKNPNETEFTVKLLKHRKTSKGVKGIQTYRSIIDFVCEHKVGVLSPKPLEDPRWNIEPGESDPSISEVICAPIQGQGEMLGLIYVNVMSDSIADDVYRFNKDHLRLLLAMAHQAAVAIEKESFYGTLVEKERMAAVGETAALMSHRINNILQGINGGSHLVEKGLANQDLSMAQKGWSIVSSNQAKISQLITDLLILGKPFVANEVFFDLRQLAAQALEHLSTTLALGDVECRLNPADGELMLDGDQDALRLAFENLVRIAVNASCENGKSMILIDFDQSDDFVSFEISYRGAEILLNPKDLTHPANRQTDRTIGGIEFAVSRKIIRGHSGDITIGKNHNGLNRISVFLPKQHQARFMDQLLQTRDSDSIREKD